MRKVFSNSFYIIICTLIIASCYDPIDGCLDPFASNYSITAENTCDDGCCNYPELSLSFSYRYDTLSLDTSQFYLNSIGDSFKINEFFLLLSEFTLIGNDNHKLVNNSKELLDYDVSTNRVGDKTDNPGRMLINDTIHGINCEIGIPNEIDNFFDLSGTISSLEYVIDSCYYDKATGFFDFGQINLQTDTIRDNSFVLNLSEPIEEFIVNQSFEQVTVQRGDILRINFIIDFKTLLFDIDLRNIASTDTLMVESAIINNLLDAVFVE